MAPSEPNSCGRSSSYPIIARGAPQLASPTAWSLRVREPGHQFPPRADDVEEHRARAPWYLTKTSPSFTDMHAKLRRVIIASQFHPGQARNSTTREITEVQQAWAAAGL